MQHALRLGLTVLAAAALATIGVVAAFAAGDGVRTGAQTSSSTSASTSTGTRSTSTGTSTTTTTASTSTHATTTTTASTSTSASTSTPATTTTSVQTAADRVFANRAAASDLFEIQSGTLALAKGRGARVKAFARTIIRDHRRSTALLKRTVGALGGSVAPTLTAAQLAQLRRLQRGGESDFDRVFRRQQIVAHLRAIALFTSARTKTSPPLRRFAQVVLPVLRKHLAMARALPQE